ncbi:TetR/AcrR family transcriptional regulator [Streptomyces johnsoniae]|uniref:TetR family transcriptional regulator n=1 Tax=Streptomyces johnsoniae TaxID=3075532 RepID=A0ABU2S0N3_9ACTN|nr:TetR family transcriptional regulator [Streptomyces sp. DSM 41886]MDT0442566.1 TetR family transcriptional regulator [Streptomyces sp. DSM 41886]
MSHTPAASESPATQGALRERKRVRTRRAIRKAAYDLFDKHGYEGTRVDQIAEAAEVSTSTVFRYFPTKEDIVLASDDNPFLEAALRARPEQETPLAALREAMRESMLAEHATPEAKAEIFRRMRLVSTVPALRARLPETMAITSEHLTRALADRTGHPPEGLELRVFVGAVVGGFREALMYWSEQGMHEDLRDVVDRALDVLENDLAV